MDIKAIIFDKDGTLIDFEATFNPATARVLNQISEGNEQLLTNLAGVLGFNLETGLIEDDSIMIAGDGMEIIEAMATVMPIEDKEVYREFIDRIFGEACLETVIALPGMIDALHALKARGIVLGVGTNDAEANATSQMNALGVKDLFAHIHGADSGYGAKPGGGMIEAFAQKVGAPISEVLMVGDSLHDLKAGKAASVVTCGVETGPAKRHELEPYADIVLASIADLPGYLA